MKDYTKQAVVAICAGDGTIRAEDVTRALALLEGNAEKTRDDLTPVTRAEAAAMLRCCTRTVYELVRSGAIRAIAPTRGNRSRLVVRADVEAVARGERVNHRAGR